MKIIASLCALLCLAGCIELSVGLSLVDCEHLTPEGKFLAGCGLVVPERKGGPHSTPGS